MTELNENLLLVFFKIYNKWINGYVVNYDEFLNICLTVNTSNQLTVNEQEYLIHKLISYGYRI